MAYSSRPTSMLPGAGLRQPAAQPSSALSTRIAAKKAELENLRQLRELSGTLAMQMQALESKIATLKDGTEAVACVLSNWENVLRAISLASSKLRVMLIRKNALANPATAEKASGLQDTTGAEELEISPNESHLPATLVRIPADRREKTGE
ncbi:DASH complex subunit DAD2 [Penicillium hispanicum]|uniref:DASH complex subunit DAD2 n=1 Tax=Penicillium hispanicum TaxID=1080232 RepID=UPI002541E598|nr:DASH complex subunit DAD2 [Penicillium hispanicum]KAJ5587942.1 DASH complex subunit DAD2 [Penicillium hispanicum]